LIYDAAADDARWPLFLDAYGRAVGGGRCFMVLNIERGNGTALFRSSNWSDEDFQRYAERCVEGDLSATAGTAHPEGAVRTIDALRQPGASTTHREGYSPRDVRYGLEGIFLRTPDGPSTIVAVRGQRDRPFGKHAVATLGPLMPHLRRAALLHNELSSMRSQLAIFSAYLDRDPHPFLLTDTQARVIYANSAANETAGLQDGLAIVSGHVSLMAPRDQAVFIKAVSHAVTARGARLRSLVVERPSHKPPYRLLLMPVPYPGPIPAGSSQAAAAAVLIVGNEREPEFYPDLVRQLFALTPAQARVTAKLAAGRSAEQIAADLSVSLATVRTHIRRVLSKTSTSRQGELISLVLRTTHFSVSD
jgi:DNA-binding CsgD family transcriptional regulator/PAS domain-containing protein